MYLAPNKLRYKRFSSSRFFLFYESTCVGQGDMSYALFIQFIHLKTTTTAYTYTRKQPHTHAHTRTHSIHVFCSRKNFDSVLVYKPPCVRILFHFFSVGRLLFFAENIYSFNGTEAIDRWSCTHIDVYTARRLDTIECSLGLSNNGRFI